MAGFDQNTSANTAVFDNTDAGLRMGIPDPYSSSLPPAAPMPNAAVQAAQMRQKSLDMFDALKRRAAPTPTAPLIGYNDAADKFITGAGEIPLSNLTEATEAIKKGALNASAPSLPPGYIQTTPDEVLKAIDYRAQNRGVWDTTKEIGKQVIAGAAVEGPKSLGDALKWHGAETAGNALNAAGEAVGNAFPKLNEAPDVYGRNAFSRDWLIPGARNLPQSLEGMGAAVAAGALTKNPFLAASIAGAVILPLFGGQQAQQTYDKLTKAGVSPTEAAKAGWINYFIEGGGETIGDVAGAKLLMGAGKGMAAVVGELKGLVGAGKMTAQTAAEMVTKPDFLRTYAKDLIENAGVQMGTEYGQNYGEAAVENAYSPTGQQLGGDPHEQGMQGLQAAGGMSTLMAPFGIPGHMAAASNRAQLGKDIGNPDKPVDMLKASQVVSQQIAPIVGNEDAKAWLQGQWQKVIDQYTQQEEKQAPPPPAAPAVPPAIGAPTEQQVETKPPAPMRYQNMANGLVFDTETGTYVQPLATPVVTDTTPTPPGRTPNVKSSISPDQDMSPGASLPLFPELPNMQQVETNKAPSTEHVPGEAFAAHRDFSLANANNDEAGKAEALARAQKLADEHGTGAMAGEYNPDQGVLPLQNEIWRDTAVRAFHKNGKGQKRAKFEAVIKNAKTSEEAAAAIRKLAFNANNGTMIKALSAAHKALTGMSLDEFEKNVGNGEAIRAKILEKLEPVELDTLARIFGWGNYDKAHSDVNIAADRGVNQKTVGDAEERLIKKLRERATALGIDEKEFRRLMGAQVGSNLWNMDVNEDQKDELAKAAAADAAGEVDDLAQVSQDALQTNATLGASETGTKRGETLYNAITEKIGVARPWDDLTDLEKQHLTALSKSIVETPEGNKDKSVTRSEIKATVREAVLKIAGVKAGEYEQNTPAQKTEKVEPPSLTNDTEPSSSKRSLAVQVQDELQAANAKLKKGFDVEEEVAAAKTEWEDGRMEGEPTFDELSPEEQLTWAYNYVRWDSAHVGFDSMTDVRENILETHRVSTGIEPIRTKSTAPESSSAVEKGAAAPATAIEEAASRVKEKAPAERKSWAGVAAELTKRISDIIKQIRGASAIETFKARSAEINKSKTAMQVKVAQLRALLEKVTDAHAQENKVHPLAYPAAEATMTAGEKPHSVNKTETQKRAAAPKLGYKFEKVEKPKEPGEVKNVPMEKSAVKADALRSTLKMLFFSPAKFDNLVKIVQSARDLSAKEYALLGDNPENVIGVSHQGKVILIADNVQKGNELSILLHEVGVHLGMEKMIGKENLKRLIKRIDDWAKLDDGSQESELAKAAVEAAAKSESSNKEEEKVAKFVSFAVDSGIDPTAVDMMRAGGLKDWFRTLMAAAKSVLRSLGFNRMDKLTAKNIVDLAYGSAKIALDTGKVKKGKTQFHAEATVEPADFKPTATWKGRIVDKIGQLGKLGISMRELAQIVREYKVLPVDKYKEAVDTRGAYSRGIVDKGVHEVLSTWNKLGKTDNLRFSKVLNEATMEQFDVSTDIGSDQNSWIGEFIKGVDPHDAEAVAEGNRLVAEFARQRERFKALPEEMKKLYSAVDKFMNFLAAEEFKNKTKTIRDAYLPTIREMATPAQRDVIDRMELAELPTKKEFDEYRKTFTEILQDHDKDKTKWNMPALAEMRKMTALIADRMEGYHQRRGLYFPLLRFGDHIVIAKSQAFNEQTKKVDSLKVQIADFKRDNSVMQKADELAGKVAEARAAARSRLGEKARVALNEVKKELRDFRATDEYKTANKELGDIRIELKNATKELGKMSRSDKHYVFRREESHDFAEQWAKHYRSDKGGNMLAAVKLRDEWIGDTDTVSSSFANKLADKLGKQYENNPVMQHQIKGAIKQIFTETQQDQSSLHRMSMRRNIRGFHEDANRVFQSHLQQAAHRLASQKHFMQVQDALTAVREAAAEHDKNPDPKVKDKYTAVANELAIRNEMDMHYSETAIQDGIARFNQVFTLGASPSFLLQQSTQPWMLTLPYLVGRSKTGAAIKALTTATSDSWRMLRESAKGSGLMSRFEVKLDDPKLSEGERAALHYCANHGLIDILLDHDVALGAKGKQLGNYDKFVEMSNWAGRQLEVTNRLATALAAYRLELGRTHDQSKAEKYAADAIEQTQVDYSNENASRWTKRNAFTGSKVIMQYKKYQIHMMQMLLWNAKEAFKGETPEARSEARRILVGMLTTHGLMGGTLGLPGVAPLMMIAQLAAWGWPADDEPDPETAYKNFLADMLGKDVADVVARGLFASLGLDLSRNLGLGSLFNPVPFMRTDKQGKEQFNEMALALLGPSVSLGQRLVDGADKLTKGDLLGAWIGMAPKYLSSPAKAYKIGTEGMETKGGAPRIPAEAFSAGDLISIALGLPDLKVGKYYEYNAQFGDAKQAADQVAAALKMAWIKGDGEEKAKVMEQIRQFNERHLTDMIRQRDLMMEAHRLKLQAMRTTPEGVYTTRRTKEFADALRF